MVGAVDGLNQPSKASCGIKSLVTWKCIRLSEFCYVETVQTELLTKEYTFGPETCACCVTRQVSLVFHGNWVCVVNDEIVLPVLLEKNVWQGVFNFLHTNRVRLVWDQLEPWGNCVKIGK